LLFIPLSAPAGAEETNPEGTGAQISITIFKGRRELWLFRGENLLKAYRIHLGSSPQEEKRERGDNKTPEGDYQVVEKKKKSPFHRFIGINYPNLKDAERAFEQGRISADEWVEILYATHTRSKPPWDTALGGSIGIHGIGTNEKFKKRLIGDMDWTNGCIAVTNREIEELFRIVPLGTTVRIRK